MLPLGADLREVDDRSDDGSEELLSVSHLTSVTTTTDDEPVDAPVNWNAPGGGGTSSSRPAAPLWLPRDDPLTLFDEGEEIRCLVEPLAARSDCREVSMVELFPFKCAILDVEQFQIKRIVGPHLMASPDR